MEVAFLAYEGMTTLDLIGPYEVLNAVPGWNARFVGKRKGEIRVDSKAFGIVVDNALSDVPRPDIFVVPGGMEGTFLAAGDEEILDWLREAHEHSQWTTSVCTGSLILGAAGVLRGKRATTHWGAVAMLEQYGVEYTSDRVVEDGKIITAAGVSSGIDMGLTLVGRAAGDDTARAVQLAIEYDPQPPYDAGSPDKAGPKIVEMASAALSGGA